MTVENQQYRETGDVQCYAIRRVNPFLGVLQVIETQYGRAISTNGVLWNLAVCGDGDSTREGENTASLKTKQYRYGMWSEGDGLISRTLSSASKNDLLKMCCESLIQCIKQRQHLLPFRLIDTVELWLFDKDEISPIALLASGAPEAIKPSPEPERWVSHLGVEGMPGQLRFPASKALEDLVLNVTSPNTRKYWVVRSEDNKGYVEQLDVELDADKFPVYLLSEKWETEQQISLVKDYIQWISPALLTLQHLDRKQRQRLEKKLYTQAVSVEFHWHLYPDLVDEKLVTAARVQSQIEKSQSG